MRFSFLFFQIIPFRYLLCNRYAVLLEKTFFVSNKLRLRLLTRTPLTPCLTYFLMPTIIFLRIICRVIGGACGEIFGTMLGQMADGNASVQNPASDRNRIKMADRYRQIFRCRHRSDCLRSRILGFGNKKTVETA